MTSEGCKAPPVPGLAQAGRVAYDSLMDAAAAKTAVSAPDLTVDVAISGGGFIGGALAVGLARHGVSVAVIDKVDPAATLDMTVQAIRTGWQSLRAEVS